MTRTDDNYALLFGAYAPAVARAYPAGPPILDREARHCLLAVLDASPQPATPSALPLEPTAFAAAYGADYQRVRPVFRRLGARPLRRGGYRRLVPRLLSDAKVARALTHFDALDERAMAVALALPRELVRPAFLALKPTVRQAAQLVEIFDLGERHGRSRAKLAEMALRCRTLETVGERLVGALTPDRLTAAPWAGDDRLRPVESVADVRRLGRQFRNCLADSAALWTVSQCTVVYRWLGEPPAVCAVERELGAIWRLVELQGPGNTPVPPAVRRDIEARLANAGIRTGDRLHRLMQRW